MQGDRRPTSADPPPTRTIGMLRIESEMRAGLQGEPIAQEKFLKAIE